MEIRVLPSFAFSPGQLCQRVIQRCLFNQSFCPAAYVRLMRFYASLYRDGSHKAVEDAIIGIATERMPREFRALRTSNCSNWRIQMLEGAISGFKLASQTKLSSEAFLLVYLDEFRFLRQNILRNFQPCHETFLSNNLSHSSSRDCWVNDQLSDRRHAECPARSNICVRIAWRNST